MRDEQREARSAVASLWRDRCWRLVSGCGTRDGSRGVSATLATRPTRRQKLSCGGRARRGPLRLVTLGYAFQNKKICGGIRRRPPPHGQARAQIGGRWV